MKIFNTLTRSKQELETIVSGHVKMYACGPTVYNYFHVGNARPFIVFDTLRRYLEYRGYEVEFCQNFTDIDDKMIASALSEHSSVKEIADRYIAEYYIDADKLHVLRPTYQPRATETMQEIIEMINTLVKKGYAYEMDDGVYFDVAKFERYGRLSHYNLDELRDGASDRVLKGEERQRASDFALWKKKKPGEPFWESPWGDGRPGWHIECSAMNKKYLGDTIDIHCGGQDLIFPHHENEIAQSEAANDAPFAKYWMHNGFVNVNNEKMSKSTGNFFTVRDITKLYSYDVIRFFVISSHYRMPINFSEDLLLSAKASFERITNAVQKLRFVAASKDLSSHVFCDEKNRTFAAEIDAAKSAFLCAMDDDLNTADAVTAIFELVRASNLASMSADISATSLTSAADMIVELAGVLGLPVEDRSEEDKVPSEVLLLLEKRTKAKSDKDFALSDALRSQVESLGYQIKDTPSGPLVTRI